MKKGVSYKEMLKNKTLDQYFDQEPVGEWSGEWLGDYNLNLYREEEE